MALDELRKVVREAPGKVQEGFRKAMEQNAKKQTDETASRKAAADELWDAERKIGQGKLPVPTRLSVDTVHSSPIYILLQ